QTLDGELVEIAVGERVEVQDRAVFHAELRGYAAEHGYKSGWSAHKFRERFGHFPPWRWNDDLAAEPSLTTRCWIKSRIIAWARAQERVALLTASRPRFGRARGLWCGDGCCASATASG